MVFSSPDFVFLLLPIILVILAVARRSGMISLFTGALLIVSLGLYLYSEPRFLIPLLLLICANYLIARQITKQGKYLKNVWLAVGILLNLIPIASLKYAGLLDPAASYSTWLPLGISFFSFQQITFLTDIRKGVIPIPTFVHYALFISFFAHLVAGPILRGDEFLGQLQPKRLLRDITREQGAALTLFAMGLVKKLVIADRLAVYVDVGLGKVSDGYLPTILEAWTLMPSAAAQIYFDYSAYADFAIALALLCGIYFPASFLSPYKALSIADFWRRWNVTLMRFFRNHIYIPLGGNRHGPLRRVVAIGCAMVACGLWHGAGMNFALWGGVVAILIILEPRYSPSPDQPALRTGHVFIRRAIVLLAYMIPLCIFLTPNLAGAKRLLLGLAGFGGFTWPSSLELLFEWLQLGNRMPFTLNYSNLPLTSLHQLALCLFAWVCIYSLPNTYEIFSSVLSPASTEGRAGKEETLPETGLAWRPNWRWMLITIALLVIALTAYQPVGSRAFFYYRF